MSQVGTKMRRQGARDGWAVGGLAHWCPACSTMHQFALDGRNSIGAIWTWDGNVEAPTFNPSMNIIINGRDHKHYQVDLPTEVCHYKLVAGVLQFQNDCTHALRGQSVPMPELPRHLQDPF